MSKHEQVQSRLRGGSEASGPQSSRTKHHEGTLHWIVMKVTAAALIPLGIWFVLSVLKLAGADHAAAVAWVKASPNAILLLLFLGTMLYHSALGIDVVAGDYLHTPWRKNAVLIGSAVLHAAAGGLAALAVLMIALKN